MKKKYIISLLLFIFLIGLLYSFKENNIDNYDQKLGHLVLQVSDTDKSTEFYTNIVGLQLRERATYDGKTRIFMSSTNEHHELVLQQQNSNAKKSESVKQRFLQQIAFEQKDHEGLVRYYKRLKKNNIHVELKNNQISWSLYFYDPDSIQIEAYWDIRKEPFGKEKFDGKQEELQESTLLNPPY